MLHIVKYVIIMENDEHVHIIGTPGKKGMSNSWSVPLQTNLFDTVLHQLTINNNINTFKNFLNFIMSFSTAGVFRSLKARNAPFMHRVQGNVSFFYVGRGNNNMTFFGRNTTT